MNRRITSGIVAATLAVTGFGIVAVAAPAQANATCTYTIGFYKNKGAALVPTGTFYHSGMTRAEILNSPSLGDAYTIAAKQFIAADLNGTPGETGFNVPGVSAEVASAYRTLELYFAGAPTSREAVLAAATVLDEYNNGLRDLPHC